MWLDFVFPIADWILDYYILFALAMMVASSFWFGWYYRANDEHDFGDVFVIPLVGVTLSSVLFPVILVMAIVGLPFIGFVCAATSLSVWLMRVAKKQKEKRVK